MTDPRLAALADVLRADFGPSWFPGLTDVTIIAKTPEEAATAILAALPPDWCGHRMVSIDEGSLVAGLRDEIADLEATFATLRADVERERAFVIAGQARENECEREIATLRAALERLRAEVAGLPVHYRRNGFASSVAWSTRRDVLAAIDRAALAAAREATE
jgi:hypothetical protein